MNYKILEKAVQLIREANKIIFVTGAGISVACGIPDFRSERSGIYNNLQQYNLVYPQQMFVKQFYQLRPRPLYELLKNLVKQHKYIPSYTHCFQRLMQDCGKLSMVITQNVDDLEGDVGIQQYSQAHGCLTKRFVCVFCNKYFENKPTNLLLSCTYDNAVPYCEQCGHVMKPDVVFFMDKMPADTIHYQQYIKESDLVIVIGTSLQVTPMNQLPVYAKKMQKKRILINRELVSDFQECSEFDCSLIGDCEDIVKKLCDQLNLKEQLEQIHQNYSQPQLTHSLKPLDQHIQPKLILCGFQKSLIVPTSYIFNVTKYGQVMLAFVTIQQYNILQEQCNDRTQINLEHFTSLTKNEQVQMFQQQFYNQNLQQQEITIFSRTIVVKSFLKQHTVYAPIHCHYARYITKFLELQQISDEKDIWDVITRHSKAITNSTLKTRSVTYVQMLCGVQNQAYVNSSHLDDILESCKPDQVHWQMKTIYAEL